MAVTMFTRFVNIRNVLNVNNFGTSGNALNVVQCLSILPRSYSTADDMLAVDDSNKQSNKKIAKAMRVYLQQAKEYKEFIEKQVAEYDIGMRHLANIMGEDPDNFSQKDADKAIRYLFPSGLYEPEARPMLAHPSKLYARRKEAEFDESGRPHHYLFYTTKPNYYDVLHKIAKSLNDLNKIEDERIEAMNLPTAEDKINLETSEWLKKKDLETKLFEELTDEEYQYFLTSIQRLVDHPLSKHATSLCMEYRNELKAITSTLKLLEFEYDENNRPYILVKNCKRKRAYGDVKVTGNGTGQITINGQDILYFQDIYCREQVSV